jgi:8-oxo-dGTP pyrophosphatase MutT (NUDIX family)
MIKKPVTMKHHGGEIAFPGGKISNEDNDLLDTAIRETREETGIIVEREKIIGQLERVTTLNSGFTILPFICILDKIENLTPNSEVEEFLEIPLVPFLQTLANDSDPEHNSIQEMYTFTFENHLVWGASARMLKQIIVKISENY